MWDEKKTRQQAGLFDTRVSIRLGVIQGLALPLLCGVTCKAIAST